MVPVSSIVFMIFSMFVGALLPVGTIIYLKRKYDLGLKPFFIGCMIIMVASTVPSLLNAYFINKSPLGTLLDKYAVFNAIFFGITIAIFEEGGKFLAMRFMLADKYDDDHNALMYGAGHGGFEAFWVLVFGNIPYLTAAFRINSEGIDSLVSLVNEASRDEVREGFNMLIETPSYSFLYGPLEKIALVAMHIALSVIVWYAATRTKKLKYLWIAMILHMFTSASVDIVNKWAENSISNGILQTIIVEVYMYGVTAFCIYMAIRIWRQNKDTKVLEE